MSGILQSSNYEPDDIFWGQLAGCMECIHVGTTTVIDHSHLNYSVEARKSSSESIKGQTKLIDMQLRQQ